MNFAVLNVLIVIINIFIFYVCSEKIQEIEKVKENFYVYVEKGKKTYSVNDKFYLLQEELEELITKEYVIVRWRGVVPYEPETEIVIDVGLIPSEGRLTLRPEALRRLRKGEKITVILNNRTITIGVNKGWGENE